MSVEVNIAAVALAFVASMVVGSIWYAKSVFGKSWMNLVGLNDKKAKEGMSAAFTKVVIVAFVQAYVLAFVTYIAAYFYADKSWLNVAILTGLAMWVLQSAAIIVHDAFEQRATKLTMINVGNQLAILLAMALVIGWLQP